MTKPKKGGRDLQQTLPYWEEFKGSVGDLLAHPDVCAMRQFRQHDGYSCFEHCVHVSYNSFRSCKRLGLNWRCAARGALLHDFFLYDWHKTKPPKGLHAFAHPAIALENAEQRFSLDPREKDIIKNHMWPLTLRPPRYMETFIVVCADKVCTFAETLGLGSKERLRIFKAMP